MKLRRFLRGLFQVFIDKYSGHFSNENGGEIKFSKTQSENKNQNFLEKDFQILNDLSQELNRQMQNGGHRFTAIATPPSPPTPSDSGFPENARPSKFAHNSAPQNYNSPSPFSKHNFSIAEDAPFEKISTGEGIGNRKFYNPRAPQFPNNQISTEKNNAQGKQSKFLKLKIEKKAQIIRQLSVLLESGMDLYSSLIILRKQETGNKNVRLFLDDLSLKIEAGDSLSDALANSIVKFNGAEIAMIHAGETVGRQSDALARMASLMEKKILIRKKIVSAMLYPATVLTIASLVILLLTTFVVPKFEKIIAEQLENQTMPTLTNIIIRCSHFITSQPMELSILGILIVAMILGVKKFTPAQKIIHIFLLKLPFIGKCMEKWDMVIFSRTFGDLLLCGCSIVESLKMARESVKNYYMRANLTLTIGDIQQGLSLTEALSNRKVLAAMAEGLIKVGEESGKLGTAMNKISSAYEGQLDEIILRTTSLIEPFLVVFLAFFVGSIVIGLFLPLVSLIQNTTG
ncbi:MAG: type II secretion system F family protein [Puniceicoccales bacterium]|jgi:type IV pilus assembly protein PilC|nr:type II secretion system F family protein [Puniceicoccales bacterium]